MVFRIFLVLLVLFVLVPREPDLGLPRLPQGNRSELITEIRATVAKRATLAVDDLHHYDDRVSLERAR